MIQEAGVVIIKCVLARSEVGVRVVSRPNPRAIVVVAVLARLMARDVIGEPDVVSAA